MRLTCIDCGKPVSTKVPANCVVRAAIQCPECTERDSGTLQAVLDESKRMTARCKMLEEDNAAALESTSALIDRCHALEAANARVTGERDKLRAACLPIADYYTRLAAWDGGCALPHEPTKGERIDFVAAVEASLGEVQP